MIRTSYLSTGNISSREIWGTYAGCASHPVTLQTGACDSGTLLFIFLPLKVVAPYELPATTSF